MYRFIGAFVFIRSLVHVRSLERVASASIKQQWARARDFERARAMYFVPFPSERPSSLRRLLSESWFCLGPHTPGLFLTVRSIVVTSNDQIAPRRRLWRTSRFIQIFGHTFFLNTLNVNKNFQENLIRIGDKFSNLAYLDLSRVPNNHLLGLPLKCNEWKL